MEKLPGMVIPTHDLNKPWSYTIRVRSEGSETHYNEYQSRESFTTSWEAKSSMRKECGLDD